MDIWNFVFNDWHVHCVYFGSETVRTYIIYIYIYIQYIEYEPKVESYQILKKIFYNYIIYIFHRQCMIYNVNDKRYNNI